MMKNLQRFRDRGIFGFFTLVFGIYVLVSNDIGTIWGDPDLLTKPAFPPNPEDIRGTEIFDTCLLKIYDPFDKKDAVRISNDLQTTINRTLQWKNPLKGCNNKYQYITQLINGSIVVNPFVRQHVVNCSYRCWNTTYHGESGPWVELMIDKKNEIDCEFIETKCVRTNNVAEHNAHFQLIEKEEQGNDEQMSKDSLPDVHIVIVDSVSSTQALRSLPLTVDFLKRNMSATFFHHLNKVGDNSRPNGFAMLLGWRIVYMSRSAVGAEDLHADHDWNATCKQYKDNRTVIFKEYGKMGYKTLYSEDYPDGTVFTWPSCNGFQTNPTTHSFRPFIHAWDQKELRNTLTKERCFELYRATMDYTQQFIRAYKDTPKFSLSWIATLSHNDGNMLFHSDSYFEKFFRDNEPHLRNSFVFFMADHGLRFGPTLNTELGQREVNNPLLMVVVPERLRHNKELMKNLEENSEKLMTQFDVHATLVDILKVAPTNNFSSFEFQDDIISPNDNNATSMLRPLGKYDKRNCGNIPVPSSYCLCEFDKELVVDENLQTLLAAFLVLEINQLFEKGNVTNLCPELIMSKPMTTWKYVSEDKDFDLYLVTAEAKPSGGVFKGTLRVDGGTGGIQRIGEIQRTNKYGKRGNCVQETPYLKQFCFCPT